MWGKTVWAKISLWVTVRWKGRLGKQKTGQVGRVHVQSPKSTTWVSQSMRLAFRLFLPTLHVRNLRHREAFSQKSPSLVDWFPLKAQVLIHYTALPLLETIFTTVTWRLAEWNPIHHLSLVGYLVRETDAWVTNCVIFAMRGEKEHAVGTCDELILEREQRPQAGRDYSPGEETAPSAEWMEGQKAGESPIRKGWCCLSLGFGLDKEAAAGELSGGSCFEEMCILERPLFLIS